MTTKSSQTKDREHQTKDVVQELEDFINRAYALFGDTLDCIQEIVDVEGADIKDVRSGVREVIERARGLLK